MISLKRFIIESLVNEGGHAVVCDRIPAEMSPVIFREIQDEIHKHYKNIDMRVLGSVGKKKAGDTNGDIDIAINITNQKELDEILNKVFPDVEKAHLVGIISIGYPYKYKGKQLVAQVDFMMQEDLDWAEFFYSSPDYTKNESQFKAAIKNHLLSLIVSEVPTDELPTMKDRQIETKYKYTLSMNGLSKQFLDYRGKKGLLKNPKKVKEMEQFISRNGEEVVAFLFEKPDIRIVNSVESLWKEIHSKNFKFPSILSNIEERFEKEVLEPNGFEMKKFLEIVK